VIVSDVPGTTRDAIDTPFERDGQRYMLIDTAGIRRRRAIEDGSIERCSVIRSFAAVRRADVVLFVCDATEGLSEQDVKIAGYVHEEGKPSIILVNKWDLVEKDTHTIEMFKKDMNVDLNFMPYVSYLFISAKTGQRVQKILSMVNEVYEQSNRRIPTGTLNDVVNEAVSMNEPPSQNGRRLKIYYATQVATQPPTFVIFVNDATLIHFSYERYLENYFRKTFGLMGTPIRLYFRNRSKEEA
jgi:GTP-binding protein